VAFGAGAIEALKEYGWPGNIRELRNVVERLLLLADGVVDAEGVHRALPAARELQKAAGAAGVGTLAERVTGFEREEVLRELERHGRNVTQTAKALGLERSHFYKKCQQVGVDLKGFDSRK